MSTGYGSLERVSDVAAEVQYLQRLWLSEPCRVHLTQKLTCTQRLAEAIDGGFVVRAIFTQDDPAGDEPYVERTYVARPWGLQAESDECSTANLLIIAASVCRSLGIDAQSLYADAEPIDELSDGLVWNIAELQGDKDLLDQTLMPQASDDQTLARLLEQLRIHSQHGFVKAIESALDEGRSCTPASTFNSQAPAVQPAS